MTEKILQVQNSNTNKNNPSKIDLLNGKIKVNINKILEKSISWLENDKIIFNHIFWWFDMFWWKNLADQIENDSKLNEKQITEIINNWWLVLTSPRQVKKAIIILWWIMLSNYARKAIRKTWPLDADTDFDDISEYINRFNITEEDFIESINFARNRYKKEFGEEVPKSLIDRLAVLKK